MGNLAPEPHPGKLVRMVELIVHHILHSRWHYWKLHIFMLWAGYNHIHTSWELVEYVENARHLVG